jgi:hypothetical protein
MVIDLPSDKGLVHFNTLSKVLALPEFVKQADWDEQIATNNLPNEAFADIFERKFPIHTKTAAYLSYGYFLTQKDKLEKKAFQRINQTFGRAAQFWGLEPEFSDVLKSLSKKAEVAASKFGLTVGQENFFPVNTPSDILKSAEQLIEHRSQFDYPLRAQAAKNIMKAAAEVGLPLTTIPEPVHKMAGLGITTKQAAIMELTTRWHNEKRASLAQPLQTCLGALTSLKSELLGGEVCEKIAEIIDRYDRLVGRPSYPENVLFAFTKHAADSLVQRIVTLVDGTSYWITDLEKAADAFEVLGKDVAQDLKATDGSLKLHKVAELLDTLPRTDAAMLKETLDVLGIKPFQATKQGMVAAVVAPLQPQTLHTPYRKAEKRATILERLEAQDPLVKRALNTIRRLKSAADEPEEPAEDKTEPPATPRGLKGMFINKAPNETTTKPV